jgi:hypothetical protein
MVIPRGLSIRTTLLTVIAGMGLLTICTSTLSLLDAVGNNTAAVRIAIRAQTSEQLFKAIIPLRNERGAQTTGLAAEDEAGAATVSDILGLRDEFEQHFDQSMRLLTSLDPSTFAPLITRLRANHEIIAQLRPAADVAIHQARGLRDPALVRDYMKITQPLLDAIVPADQAGCMDDTPQFGADGGPDAARGVERKSPHPGRCARLVPGRGTCEIGMGAGAGSRASARRAQIHCRGGGGGAPDSHRAGGGRQKSGFRHAGSRSKGDNPDRGAAAKRHREQRSYRNGRIHSAQ